METVCPVLAAYARYADARLRGASCTDLLYKAYLTLLAEKAG